jgi:hypothetical protein
VSIYVWRVFFFSALFVCEYSGRENSDKRAVGSRQYRVYKTRPHRALTGEAEGVYGTRAHTERDASERARAKPLELRLVLQSFP